MAETANDFLDRLVAARDSTRTGFAAVRRLVSDATPGQLDRDRASAARALAGGIKSLGQQIVAQAEELERKL